MADSDTVKATSARDSSRDSSFRRLSDKLLAWACCTVLVLVGTVWGITWYQTDAKTTAVGSRVDAAEQIQKTHAERIIKLEVLQTQTEKHLTSIDSKQSQMEGKLESVQQAVNQVLIEIRKK